MRALSESRNISLRDTCFAGTIGTSHDTNLCHGALTS